jgi:hypothetical protein
MTRVFILRYTLESGCDLGTFLLSPELDKSTTIIPFVGGPEDQPRSSGLKIYSPSFRHIVEITNEL